MEERTMIKTITFAIMHFSVAFGVAYALTGDVVIGGAVAMVEPAVNTVGYYFHEKIWAALGKRRAAPVHTHHGEVSWI
jgi:uncharacterized membrane protein